MSMKQTIVLLIGQVEFTFKPTVQDHSDFVDTISRGESMTAAAHNFVMRTIDENQKEDMKKLLTSSPGAEVQIANMVKAEFSPILEIKVKK